MAPGVAGGLLDGDGHNPDQYLPGMRRCTRTDLLLTARPDKDAAPRASGQKDGAALSVPELGTVPAELGAAPFSESRPSQDQDGGRRQVLEAELRRATAKRDRLEAVIAYLTEELS